MSSPHAPKQLHPKGDIYGDIRLPAYSFVMVDSQKARHPMRIEGRYASCEIHDTVMRSTTLVGETTECGEWSKNWHNRFSPGSIPVLHFPTASTQTPWVLAFHVLSTMIRRIQSHTQVTATQAAWLIDHFAEIGKDPDWLQDQPKDMTYLQWAIHLHYEDEAIDKWLRCGSFEALTFALSDTKANKSYQLEVLDVGVRQPITEARVNIALYRSLCSLRGDPISITSYNLLSALCDDKVLANGRWALDKSDATQLIEGARSHIKVGPVAPKDWTPADAPVKSEGHVVICRENRLLCTEHNDSWCDRWLENNEHTVSYELENRLEQRISAVSRFKRLEIPTPIFNWAHLDLGPSYIGKIISPPMVAGLLTLGINGEQAEEWVGRGLHTPELVAIAVKYHDRHPDTSSALVAQALSQLPTSPAATMTDKFLLQADARTTGVIDDWIDWKIMGWNSDDIEREFQMKSDHAGNPRLGTPIAVPQYLARSEPVPRNINSEWLEKAVEDWSVPVGWEGELSVEIDTSEQTLSL